MKNLYLFSLLLIILHSCTNLGSDFKSIDVVTGIDTRDNAGIRTGTWNIPNEKPGDLILYPNPFSTHTLLFNTSNAKNIWVIPADCSSGFFSENLKEELDDLKFNTSKIENLSVMSIPDSKITDNSIVLDLSDQEEGFYRVYCEENDGSLYWINTYIYREIKFGNDFVEEIDEACK